MSRTNEIDIGIAHIAAHDPHIAMLTKTYPRPSFQPHTNYYKELVESIISQQLSVKAAATISQRFADSFEASFPSPSDILMRDESSLRAVGLSAQKARYIRDLSTKVVDGTLAFDHFQSLSNKEIVAELTAVKGIGEWTAHMFLMFCMGRLDVLPVGDLGIKNGVATLYNLTAVPDALQLAQIAADNNWRPYESIASWYIWKSLSNEPA